MEAWADFYAWIKTQPKWAEMTRKEKGKLYQAEHHRREGVNISRRVLGILETHGAERYEILTSIIIKE